MANWGFQLGFAPYFVIAAFYAYYGDDAAALGYGVTTVLFMGLMGFWLLAAMPENMQKNGGQGQRPTPLTMFESFEPGTRGKIVLFVGRRPGLLVFLRHILGPLLLHPQGFAQRRVLASVDV